MGKDAVVATHEEVYYNWESTLIPGLKLSHINAIHTMNGADATLSVENYEMTSSKEKYNWKKTDDVAYAIEVARKIRNLKVIKITVTRTETMKEEDLSIEFK